MQETLCMCMIETHDHKETLKVINEALQIQLGIVKEKEGKFDLQLSRLYEEKSSILRL
jgi:hypothetical protein